MPLNAERLKAYAIADRQASYSRRDTILYALGVGAGKDDPQAQDELRYVYEKHLVALPTMACILGFQETWQNDPLMGVTKAHGVHGEQMLEIHRPLPVEARIVTRERIDGVYDKGPAHGALVYASRTISDAATGELYATVGTAYFLRADGGFGGAADSAPRPHAIPQDRAPDVAVELATRPEQALLYRLLGDYFELHCDPAFARQAGFPAPVLHGLCTYGFVARALGKALCGSHAERIRRLNARFSAPVFPGETIRTEVWREGPGRAAFRAVAVERDAVVLNNGLVEFES